MPISHMSGAVARVSIDGVNGDLGELRIASLIVLCFLAGAVLSGTVIGGDKLIPGRRYGATLLIEALALAIAAWCFMHQDHRAAYWATFACGVQNAMATSYCGLVLRTTHVTGIVTDLGILIGHWLRHRREEPWRMLFLSGLLLGFAVGGVAGAAAWQWLGQNALWPAAAAVTLAGCGYLIWHRLHRGELGDTWRSAAKWKSKFPVCSYGRRPGIAELHSACLHRLRGSRPSSARRSQAMVPSHQAHCTRGQRPGIAELH